MLLDKLKQYYISNNIHSENFNCKFYSECSKGFPEFTEAKSSSVPDKYSESSIKIVFLSLDSGSSFRENKDRTPEAVKYQNQNCSVGKLNKGRHWYQTHYWATEILNEIENINIKIEDSKYYFAHVNAAKCCQNKKNHREADKVLFKNCRVYLKEELQILSPDIIITQGNQAKFSLLSFAQIKKEFDYNVKKIDIGFDVLWVHTPHPSAFGHYYKIKNDLPNIVKVLKRKY